jgi:hypothetical protein
VKGAFDAVLPGRMLQRLADQGWPAHVIRWVRSFLEGRIAAIKMEGACGEHTPTTGSLPQGSPISPILFMLYMAPLFTAERARGAIPRAGYADDGRLGACSPSLARNVKILEEELRRTVEWCSANALSLDMAKSELLHFTRARSQENPPVCAPHAVTPVPLSKAASLKWLGVHFDRKLTFRPHVLAMAAKATCAARALRMLGG